MTESNGIKTLKQIYSAHKLHECMVIQERSFCFVFVVNVINKDS